LQGKARRRKTRSAAPDSTSFSFPVENHLVCLPWADKYPGGYQALTRDLAAGAVGPANAAAPTAVAVAVNRVVTATPDTVSVAAVVPAVAVVVPAVAAVVPAVAVVVPAVEVTFRHKAVAAQAVAAQAVAAQEAAAQEAAAQEAVVAATRGLDSRIFHKTQPLKTPERHSFYNT